MCLTKDYMSEMYWKHVYHSRKTLYLQRDYGVRESGVNPELCPQRYASEFSRNMPLQTVCEKARESGKTGMNESEDLP